MAALRAAKQALRKEIKKRVAALGDQEKLRQSHVVTQKLLKHPKYESSRRIAVFLSMNDEVRTEEIIEDMFRRGKECFIPKYLTNSSHMDMLSLAEAKDIQSLPITSWNIRQPGDDEVREEALATGGLDLILMPGLGFDKSGNRLGRGKGFYDTYLERCMRHPKGKPYTIGLAFKEQICKEVPVDDNDIHIDEVLYEDA
ncbi:5,10-methenyltetrahydrofolate synthetase (5-formyltetrahydrofolate cyclo-ligase) isoform X1 [Megalops cyprinoides]|uniref:5,10-methenyltetrahydrofolate synthetase (5-formyltetrahydrofolate cyclo-ligase) isoform X1 n=2 Tax=Megalops cyprinoides TaxID=118141 RepID=UPI001864669F|nr:5,10-methenyltetrahydrofolate synthetase (5-formyltetrahydrofolate cyclo-ligase) isoform X1 [Megalops cyprinoides]